MIVAVAVAADVAVFAVVDDHGIVDAASVADIDVDVDVDCHVDIAVAVQVKMVYYAAHDTNLLYLAELLDLKWVSGVGDFGERSSHLQTKHDFVLFLHCPVR